MVSIWTGFVVFIADTFFKKHVDNYWEIIITLELICLFVFLFSELMKLIIKIRLKNKKTKP